MIYLITFSSNTDSDTRRIIIDNIEILGDYKCLMSGVYLLYSEDLIEVIQDTLLPVVENNSIIIVDITNSLIEGLLPKSSWDWLKQHKD